MKKLFLLLMYVLPSIVFSNPGILCPIPGDIAPKSLIELGREVKKIIETETI